jgi:hypothetical protein
MSRGDLAILKVGKDESKDLVTPLDATAGRLWLGDRAWVQSFIT